MKNQKLSLKERIMKFLNSSKIILTALSLLIIIILFYCYHITNVSKTYIFNGKSEYVSISNGAISFNFDVHLFVGSDITYVYAEDIEVSNYMIGYYVEIGDEMHPLVVQSGTSELGYSLGGLIQSGTRYNAHEPYHNNVIFTKELREGLENGKLYFVIEAETMEGETILHRTELNLDRISK